MDHNDSTNQKCTHKQCDHGRCLNHSPEWKNIGEKRLEPNPIVFGWWKISLFNRCCGKPMLRMKEVQLKKCKKCGRQEYQVENYYINLCSCCGRHFTDSSAYEY